MASYPNLGQAAQTTVAGYHGPKHPGLLQDVLLQYGDGQFGKMQQEEQKAHLADVARAAANHPAPPLAEWDALATAVGAETWEQTTIWRLAMHLARPTAVENAAVCLHPIYGCPYLPGSGLKGLARACAEELKADGDTNVTDGDIAAVFGTVGASGRVMFLDAWPVCHGTLGPILEVDITNNHHREYYTRRGKTPPGDWETPNLVYFLTVAGDKPFRFGVARASAACTNEDLSHAKTWLQRGLQDLGFGAKTAAGYGYFGEPADTAAAGHAPSAAKAPDAAGGLDGWIAETIANASAQAIGDIETKLRSLPEAAARRNAAQALLAGLKGHKILDHVFKKKGTTFRQRIEAFCQE